MLGIVGIPPAEQAVYEVLVDSQAMTAAELRARLRLTAQQLRPALKALRALGLVSRSAGPPERFTAMAPEVALEALFLQKEHELKQGRVFAAFLRDRYQEAAAGRQPSELIEVLHGGEQITMRVEQVMRTARREVRFVDKPPYAQPPSTLHPVERELLGKGVRFRGIYDRRALDLHDLRADLEAGLGLGEEARVIAEAPIKMILADTLLGLIPLRSGAPTLSSALVVHPSALLDALDAWFGNLWQQAVPLVFSGDEAPDAGLLSAEHTRLLALLTTGMPDRSIAKNLGLSYRTYQRRLSDLMRALGADTRFQAGLRAAARGWAELPLAERSELPDDRGPQ
ncbi:helix-turn-helix domain-containing protein [Amycolatopsis nigrescens]|uniref:helix-turn-helix domain-containing protein n=1 Tax=Amycolatopsis nigrescens TaxID=381445 RepID=UPI000364015E|nr:helix-turn-helix domain-containing protein [Amycolatopsis nigrescens]